MTAASAMPVSAAPGRLASVQVGVLVALGLAFWLAAALFIRAFPELFDEGSSTLTLFAAAAGIAWPTVRLSQRLARLRPDQFVAGVAVGSAAAMLADGVGLVWSSLYAVQGSAPVAAAAWLLWAVGWLVVAAAFRRT